MFTYSIVCNCGTLHTERKYNETNQIKNTKHESVVVLKLLFFGVILAGCPSRVRVWWSVHGWDSNNRPRWKLVALSFAPFTSSDQMPMSTSVVWGIIISSMCADVIHMLARNCFGEGKTKKHYFALFLLPLNLIRVDMAFRGGKLRREWVCEEAVEQFHCRKLS